MRGKQLTWIQIHFSAGILNRMMYFFWQNPVEYLRLNTILNGFRHDDAFPSRYSAWKTENVILEVLEKLKLRNPFEFSKPNTPHTLWNNFFLGFLFKILAELQPMTQGVGWSDPWPIVYLSRLFYFARANIRAEIANSSKQSGLLSKSGISSWSSKNFPIRKNFDKL